MSDAANGRRGALPPGVAHSLELSERLREGDYLADEGLSTAIFLALKRRCLYFYIDHPGLEREVEIVRLRVPGAEEHLARQVAQAVQKLRNMNLYKPPGVAETLDWTEALVALGARELDEDLISATLGSVLKYREDQQRTMGMALSLLTGGGGA